MLQFRLLPAALLSWAVRGAVVDMFPPEPQVTARALLPRADAIYGWYSAGMQEGSTVWNAATYDSDALSITSSGGNYGFCSKSVPCNIWRGCSGDYVLLGSTSWLCERSSSTCSYNELYPSVGASSSWRGYWCNDKGNTGITLFATTAGASDATDSATTTTTGDPTAPTSGLPSASTQPSLPTQTILPEDSPSPSPSSNSDDAASKAVVIGGAVGGTLGGIALIGAIAFGIIFYRRRAKKADAAAAAGANTGGMVGGQQMPPPPPGVAQMKPVGPHDGYYGHQQQQPVVGEMMGSEVQPQQFGGVAKPAGDYYAYQQQQQQQPMGEMMGSEVPQGGYQQPQQWQQSGGWQQGGYAPQVPPQSPPPSELPTGQR
ncbi:hypothetical protein EJ04DRAFT_516838 [Polyplosphaeria fusca]|uniref:Uncharacterized protein n=1 Tax=Polyplosphaeria fusca TaxID=682080 RepID=A0A9P4QKD0_9PLEO|nr:hypothetical protein EJ04DRAFT_516838 [Polyplosphaeria fusca]